MKSNEITNQRKYDGNSANNKIDVIQIAIQQLIESKQSHTYNNNNDDDNQLLSNLISQLEALKADGVIEPSEPIVESEVASCTDGETETKGKEDESDVSKSNNTAAETEEVVKELKKLKKQNKTTHWLLSVLILLTVAWQLSEVSLLLKLKESVTNPFQSVGNMFKGIINFKRPRSNDQEQSLITIDSGNDSLLNLPNIELPDLVTNGEKE